MHYVREGNEYTIPGCGGIDREMHEVFNVPHRQADKLYVVACVCLQPKPVDYPAQRAGSRTSLGPGLEMM